MKTLKQTLHLILWLAVCQLPGLVGSGAVTNHLDWYRTLARPPFTPPDAAFGAAWGVLYILLGICAWLLFKTGYRTQKKTLTLFIIQLVLNSLWTPLFFGCRLLLPALILLLVLLGQALWLFKDARPAHPKAVWLLAPYIAWMAFAAYLNIGYWVLN